MCSVGLIYNLANLLTGSPVGTRRVLQPASIHLVSSEIIVCSRTLRRNLMLAVFLLLPWAELMGVVVNCLEQGVIKPAGLVLTGAEYAVYTETSLCILSGPSKYSTKKSYILNSYITIPTNPTNQADQPTRPTKQTNQLHVDHYDLDIIMFIWCLPYLQHLNK